MPRTASAERMPSGTDLARTSLALDAAREAALLRGPSNRSSSCGCGMPDHRDFGVYESHVREMPRPIPWPLSEPRAESRTEPRALSDAREMDEGTRGHVDILEFSTDFMRFVGPAASKIEAAVCKKKTDVRNRNEGCRRGPDLAWCCSAAYSLTSP